MNGFGKHLFCHPEPFAYRHPEPFTFGHPEQSEGSRVSVQGKLREGSRFSAQDKLHEGREGLKGRDPSLPSVVQDDKMGLATQDSHLGGPLITDTVLIGR
jgi:hypothetical protein